MLLAAVSFTLCAWHGDLAWFMPWRVFSGLLGGLLMGLAGPAVQAAVPVRLQGLAAGLLFSGVGIMAGAVLVPALLPFGLPASWLALAAAAALLAVVTCAALALGDGGLLGNDFWRHRRAWISFAGGAMTVQRLQNKPGQSR